MSRDPEEHKAAKVARPASERTRDERLKAALKANMARRKAQAKARSGGRVVQDDGGGETPRNDM